MCPLPARIAAGKEAAGALADFSQEVAGYRADGVLPVGIGTALGLALRSVGALL